MKSLSEPLGNGTNPNSSTTIAKTASNRIGNQKIAKPFASNSLVTRETPNEISWNGIDLRCVLKRAIRAAALLA
jgi:hypothetical protein